MKYSFKTYWIDEEEQFKVELLADDNVIETKTFDYRRDMFAYIDDTMCMLQIAGEDWTFTY